MLKKIALGILALIILLVLVGFLLPGKIEVSRSITVNAPPEYSFEEIDQLENWKYWSYWNTLDTSMVVTYGEKNLALIAGIRGQAMKSVMVSLPSRKVIPMMVSKPIWILWKTGQQGAGILSNLKATALK